MTGAATPLRTASQQSRPALPNQRDVEVELTLLQCSRCKSGRIASDDDPQAGVTFQHCLACGHNGAYLLRDRVSIEACHGGCEREVLHGRECLTCGGEIEKQYESRVFCSTGCMQEYVL